MAAAASLRTSRRVAAARRGTEGIRLWFGAPVLLPCSNRAEVAINVRPFGGGVSKPRSAPAVDRRSARPSSCLPATFTLMCVAGSSVGLIRSFRGVSLRASSVPADSKTPGPGSMWRTTAASVRMPRMIYGTAWKSEQTAELVEKAIETGFRGIDTACQPRHYREELVGEALQRVISKGLVERKDIFLQTKFTPPPGQDPASIPYNPRASVTAQVLESFNVSLRNLGTNYIDSLVLHSPLNTFEKTAQAWKTMEDLQLQGKVGQIGISNCYDLSTLQNLCKDARIKPAILQNRFYADTLYDTNLRKFCDENNIIYQSFWTLTANPGLLYSPQVRDAASRLDKTEAQILFKYLSMKGIVPLTGTKDLTHMQQDLEVISDQNFNLQEEDVSAIDDLIFEACKNARDE